MGKNSNLSNGIAHWLRIPTVSSSDSPTKAILRHLWGIGRWSWIPLALIGIMLLFQSSSAGAPIPQEEFEARKQEMIDQDTLIWAWLEKCDQDFDHYNDLIWTRFVQIWQYKYAERSKRQAQPLMARVR